jgi:hypothetical protein
MSSRWFQVRRIHRIQTDVEIKNVILDDLLQSPFSARIEFEKVYTNPTDHTELKNSSGSDGRPALPMSSART